MLTHKIIFQPKWVSSMQRKNTQKGKVFKSFKPASKQERERIRPDLRFLQNNFIFKLIVINNNNEFWIRFSYVFHWLHIINDQEKTLSENIIMHWLPVTVKIPWTKNLWVFHKATTNIYTRQIQCSNFRFSSFSKKNKSIIQMILGYTNIWNKKWNDYAENFTQIWTSQKITHPL